MTTKKQTRKVQKPAKEGTIPRDVVEAAVKAVSGKATEKVSTVKVVKPTTKSLQQEVVSLKEELEYTNTLVKCLEKDVLYLNKEITTRDDIILGKNSKINDLENRSILAQILFALSKPFR